RWIDALAQSRPEDALPDELEESYTDLARLILEHSLPGASGDPISDEDLDRLLAGVARGNRRTRQSISSTLSRFRSLTRSVVSYLAETGEVSEDAGEVLKTAIDVDDLLDRSLHRLVRVLEESAMRAERERSTAMRAIMEVLSHELDNRLGAARTATEMLTSPRMKLDQDDLERIGNLVRSSLDEAMRTVDDVESLVGSWGAASTSAAADRRILLPVLLRKIVDELEPSAREAGVDLRLGSGQVQEAVDAPRLRLILFNLVSNGIKYRDPAKDERWVRITSDVPDGGRLRIRVEDNGIGIAPEDHAKIFRLRARVGNGLDGSGLGLAIAHEAAEQLGGTVTVESEPGRGSTFTILLLEKGGAAQSG
ncbi:MAG: HAMP domain-containing sensor histidine kinase, partial [Longimicrobiales bacterium]|nr:HAMP domain-containing sensor histidine kinase [Longimicrobiales bacterium]